MIRRIALFMLGAGILAASRVVPNAWGLPGLLKIGGCYLAGWQSAHIFQDLADRAQRWANRRAVEQCSPVQDPTPTGPRTIRPHRGDRVIVDDPHWNAQPPSPETVARVAEFERDARRMIGNSIAKAQKGTDFHGRPLPRTDR